MTRTTLNIDLNRVEGDLEFQVDLDGNRVVDARCVGTLFRGFEQLLIGRAPKDGLVITPRVCGICGTAHLYTAALALDPRRSSTWTPLAEALALAGRKDESQAALWVAYQWSGNREKSLAFYSDRAEKEKAVRPAISELYASVLGWVTDGRRPRLASLMAG